MSWPWETRTSTCRNLATISSGLYRFLAIAVLLDVETYLKSDHFVGGESLQVISSSPGELEPVFQAMPEKATDICEAKFDVLQLLEGDGFRAVALHDVPPT